MKLACLLSNVKPAEEERGAGLTLALLQLICRLVLFELSGQHGDRHPGVQQARVQRRNPGQEAEAPCRV